MNCNEARLELAGSIRGEVTGSRAQALSAHLRVCAVCSQDLGELEETMELVARVPAELPPAELRDGMWASVLADRMGPRIRAAVPSLPPVELRKRVLEAVERPASVIDLRTRRQRRRELILGVAAAVAFILAGMSWMQLQQARDQLDERPTAASIPTGHETEAFMLEGEMTAEASLVHYRHDNFRLTISVDGFEVTPPGFQYAVWLRGEEGDIALGGFRLKRADDFDVPFAIAVDPARYPEVVVTLEPVDGDPGLGGQVVSSALLDPTSVHHGEYND